MAQHILILKVDDEFYREFSEHGATEEVLLEQLQFDLQDQLEEYDLPQLLARLIASEDRDNLMLFAPKRHGEREAVAEEKLCACN